MLKPLGLVGTGKPAGNTAGCYRRFDVDGSTLWFVNDIPANTAVAYRASAVRAVIDTQYGISLGIGDRRKSRFICHKCGIGDQLIAQEVCGDWNLNKHAGRQPTYKTANKEHRHGADCPGLHDLTRPPHASALLLPNSNVKAASAADA